MLLSLEEDGRWVSPKAADPKPGNSSAATLPGFVQGVIFFCTSPSAKGPGESEEEAGAAGAASAVGFSAADSAFVEEDFNYSMNKNHDRKGKKKHNTLLQNIIEMEYV